MLISERDSEGFALDRVRQFSIDNRVERVRVELDNGQALNVSTGFWRFRVATSIRSMTPALPGIYHLSVDWDEDGNPLVYRSNIIGWAVTYDGFVHPVTVQGVSEKEDGIEFPDGRIDRRDNDSSRDFEEFRAKLIEEARRRKAA